MKGTYVIPLLNENDAEKMTVRAEDADCAVELLSQQEMRWYLRISSVAPLNPNLVMLRIHGLDKRDIIKVVYAGSWVAYFKVATRRILRRGLQKFLTPLSTQASVL